MKRRIALLSAAGAAMAATAAASAAATGGKERVVVQCSVPDPKMWNQFLNYQENLRELYGEGNVQVEIVALGFGIGVLQLESTQAPRVADAIKAGMIFSACGVTMRKKKLKKEDMLPGLNFVEAGLGRIIQRQREGWAFITS